ncbi:MAG: type IV pilus assembly protein PilM [bacterium]
MFYESNITIGVDIGADSIKYVKLKLAKGSLHLLSYGMMSIHHLRDKPFEQKIPELAQILKELLRKEKRKARIYAAVSGSDVIIKTFAIARMAQSKLQKAVFLASQKHIPFPMNEANLAYQVVGDITEKKVEKKEVLIVSATKSLIDKHINLYNQADLQVDSISIKPLASWNLMKRAVLDPQNFVLINIGAESTEINIFENGSLKFSREIITAGDSITESIRSVNDCSFEEAENIKKEYDLSKKGLRADMYNAIIPVIARLMKEIQKSFSYYQQSHPEYSARKFYLTGGTAKLKGLPHILQHEMEREMDLEIEVLNVFDSFKINPSSFDVHELNELAPQLSTSVGLALGRKGEMDLLPVEIKEKKAMACFLPFMRVSIIFLLTMLSLLSWNIRMYVKNKERALEVCKFSSNSLPAEEIKPSPPKEFGRIEKTLERLKRRNLDLCILKEITRIKPESVIFKNISLTAPVRSQVSASDAPPDKAASEKSGTFGIEGIIVEDKIASEVELLQFLALLDASSFFKHPTLLSKEESSINAKDILKFSLYCELE